jgi:hypothetical protein
MIIRHFFHARRKIFEGVVCVCRCQWVPFQALSCRPQREQPPSQTHLLVWWDELALVGYDEKQCEEMKVLGIEGNVCTPAQSWVLPMGSQPMQWMNCPALNEYTPLSLISVYIAYPFFSRFRRLIPAER